MTRNQSPQQRLAKRMGWLSTPRTPNWDTWKLVKSAPLWEIVALSLGVEPDDIRGWDSACSRFRPSAEFIERLRYLESILSINGGSLACIAEGNGPQFARVELGNFRAWSTLYGLTLCSSFPNQPATHPPIEILEHKKIRLTLRIEEVSKSHKNYMEIVAAEEKVSIARIQQIVGNRLTRKKTIHDYEAATNSASES